MEIGDAHAVIAVKDEQLELARRKLRDQKAQHEKSTAELNTALDDKQDIIEQQEAKIGALIELHEKHLETVQGAPVMLEEMACQVKQCLRTVEDQHLAILEDTNGTWEILRHGHLVSDNDKHTILEKLWTQVGP